MRGLKKNRMGRGHHVDTWTSRLLDQLGPEGRVGENNLKLNSFQINGKGAPWTFQDIHPTKNQLLLGNILGFVSIYNFLSNEHVMDRDLSIEDEITQLKYSPQVFCHDKLQGTPANFYLFRRASVLGQQG